MRSDEEELYQQHGSLIEKETFVKWIEDLMDKLEDADSHLRAVFHFVDSVSVLYLKYVD